MSLRDRELLRLMDLSMSDAAELFGLTRQAIHAGISKPSDYFMLPHLVVLVQYAKVADLATTFEIIRFIEKNYELQSKILRQIKLADLIVPRRAGIRTLLNVCSAATGITILLTNNIEHLGPRSLLTVAIKQLLSRHRDIIDFVVGDLWWFRNIAITQLKIPDSVKVAMRPFLVDDAPTPVIMVVGPDLRGFVVGRLSVEEIDPVDARTFWLRTGKWKGY